MKFTKKRTDMNGQETGDFYGFDASALYDELKPLNARCDTAEVEITVYPNAEGVVLDEEAIRAAVILHGSLEQIEARRLAKIAAEQAERDKKTARDQAIMDNLPSWNEVVGWIEAVTTIAGCKIILKRLARVVYWLAKDKID